MKVTVNEMAARANQIRNNSARLIAGYETRIKGIRFRFSNRMTRRAGQARIRENQIDISIPYFEDRENFEQHFENTVTHEIAHLITPPKRMANGRRDIHGPEWAATHRRLGGNGETCHTMERPAGCERKTYSVDCPCGCGKVMQLGPTQYKRWQNGTRYRIAGH